MKKIIYIFLFTFLGIGVAFAADNFIKRGNNFDANVGGSVTNANDVFELEGRLDLEDSRTNSYINDRYRGKITGKITSELFGVFHITDKISLTFKSKNPNKSKCGNKESLELYNISGKIKSPFWGEMEIDEGENQSYFCSNKFVYIKLKSASLGNKKIGNSSQGSLIDDFGKQEISISGISNLKGNIEEGIESRGDGKILRLGVSISVKNIAKEHINKNIAKLFKTYNNTSFIKTASDSTQINEFENLKKENYYLYNYSEAEQTIQFNGNYKNKGKILELGTGIGNNKMGVDGKHTIILKGGNVYIKSNIYNKNNKSLLIIISKKIDGKGGNIYIDPKITNIDAVLIADGSLISFDGTRILSVEDNVDGLRKQLLIYGSIFTSNTVGTDKIPYGADYYEDSQYPTNEMSGSIYDLGNLRTFNLNYGKEDWSSCKDNTKLVPIQGSGYIKNAWAGRKECYISENGDSDLRKSDKKNPLIVEYNKRIKFIEPFILQNN